MSIQQTSVENKRSTCPDLHAFILLDELFPGAEEICYSREDGICLKTRKKQIKTLWECLCL